MKKQKKRYLTANQIRYDIERYQAKMKFLEKDAARLEAEANQLQRHNPSAYNRELSAFKLKQADKAHRAIARIHDKKLPYMKQKLAEWSTELLPGVIPDNDRSVEV